MVSGATNNTPFWMYANKSGSVPIEQYYASGQWGVYKLYNPNNPRLLQFSGGAEVVTNYGKSGNVFFTDAYAAAKLGAVELLVGQKRNIVGLADSTLGTGTLGISGNSRPFPRIQLSLPDFQPLAITNDFISVKGGISDGYLGGSNINYGAATRINRTYFHQKQIYFRIGERKARIKVYAGMNHQVIWGGEKQLYPIENLSVEKSYFYVLTGKSLHYRKVGNHFGTIDLAVDFRVRNLSFLIYRNSIYDTGSLFKIINVYDGLNGLKIVNTNKNRNKASIFKFFSANIEYLSLYNQKNQFHPSGLVIYQIADYYNSYIYQRGWSYNGFGVGTPLVPSGRITYTDLPKNRSQFTNNNRINAFHSAITGQFLGIDMLLKGTYSRNSGTYLAPFEKVKNQLSLFISADKRLKILHGASLTAGVASDIGDLYPNSTGIFIGIKKSAFIN